jgi:hypothetical protein
MRPVVGSYSCMTSKASEALCDVIGGMLTKHQSVGEESISTEDMVSKLQPAEGIVKEELKGGGETVNANVQNLEEMEVTSKDKVMRGTRRVRQDDKSSCAPSIQSESITSNSEADSEESLPQV